MTWWLWLIVSGGVGAVMGALVGAVIALVGHQSYEGRGTLDFDTPEARKALQDRG